MAPRRIVLLSDGTGNSSATVWRTNVWRMFSALDFSSDEQVSFYDDGVGTSSFKPLAILGGVFGWGLKRNVIALYKFACRNFRNPNDEIYGFGFSRGAFTIRVVIGLILDQGLIPANQISESELERLAKEAYADYRKRHFHTNWARLRRERPPTTFEVPSGRNIPAIKFLGLWDTVAAYGLPIDEMTQGVSQWIYPMEIPNHTLHPSVQRACHALSLDDERTTFHPVLWDESNQPAVATPALTTSQRITQIWFTGVHANVGGGYPDDSLAYIPLYWIMEEARAAGLKFKLDNPAAIPEVKQARDKDGRLYDSRSGLGGYYRYGPRRISYLCNEIFSEKTKDQVFVAKPKIHESVFQRIANHAHLYAPIGIPDEYQVVRTKPIAGSSDVTFEIIDLPVASTAALPHLETAKQAQARVIGERKSIWPPVMYRGLVYLATLAATMLLVAFPFTGRSRPLAERHNELKWVSDGIRFVADFLPGWASTLLTGYAQYPWMFLFLCVFIFVLICVGNRLASSINDNMTLLWRQSMAGTLVPLEAPPSRTPSGIDRAYDLVRINWRNYVGPFVFAVSFVFLVLTFAERQIFTAFDQAGFTCEKSTTLSYLPAEGALISFPVSNPCFATGYRVGRLDEYYIWTTPDLKQLEQEHPGYKTDRMTCKPSPLKNGSVATDGRGYSTFNNFEDAGIGIVQTVKHFFLSPMRRYYGQPWFQPVARYGNVGEEVDFLEPDPARTVTKISEWVTPKVTDELYFYVNDAVFPVQKLQLLYDDNDGCISFYVRPKKPGG